MKRILAIVALTLMATAAQAAAKITVAELKAKLAEMRHQSKDDGAVADWLKTVDLSEQLTRETHYELERLMPGPLSTVQLAIHEGRSAFLPPPAIDVPGDPAPEAAAQQALLAKAVEFATKSYAQLPHLTATRSAAHFQDGARNMSSTPGLTISAENPFEQITETSVETADFDHGQEKAPASKAKTKWGSNGKISEDDPTPAMSQILSEAQTAGKLAWVRWQKENGQKAAVFSFAVEKKKTKFALNICCFPVTDMATGVAAGGTLQPLPGEIQSVTTWRAFRKQTGYHGQVAVDAESGAVLQIVFAPELKPGDNVRSESARIDYQPQTINGQTAFLPEAAFVLNEVVANGDNPTAIFQTRHMLVVATYKDYKAN